MARLRNSAADRPPRSEDSVRRLLANNGRRAVTAEGDRAWGRVSSLIATKKPAEYDQTVALLGDLRVVAAADEFGRRLGELRETRRRKPSLIERLDRARSR